MTSRLSHRSSEPAYYIVDCRSLGHPPDFQAILRPKLFNNGNPREEPFSFSVSSIYLLFPWLEAEPSEAAEANPETTVEAAISLNRRTTLCVCSLLSHVPLFAMAN